MKVSHWREIGSPVCMEVSAGGDWEPSVWRFLIGEVAPVSDWLGYQGRETSSSSCWTAEQATALCGRCRYCLVLRGVIGACQGHGTSTFGPVLTPVLPKFH